MFEECNTNMSRWNVVYWMGGGGIQL